LINLESKRLWLRPLTPDDLDFLIELHADQEVSRYIWHGKPRTQEQTRIWLERTFSLYQQEQIGHLGVVQKSDGQIIGRCGLNCFEIEIGVDKPQGFWGRGAAPKGVNVEPNFELGYTLDRKAWGYGYATEAAQTFLDYAFYERHLSKIISLIHPENTRSINVANRLGMQKQDSVLVFGVWVWRYALGPG